MTDKDAPPSAGSFEQQAQAESSGLVSELFAFLRANKKWWLLPILIVLFGVGLLVVLGGTAAAPFIYTLF